ncbi:fusA [Symbiodinium sp. KB8]|nr:fusA [Symbiodinium sp. KB8]
MKRIRNIGIMAHIDAGKTTTTERLLFLSGYSRRVGEVHDGDTIMDYLPLERERGITINSAAISFQWANHDINLIDTPGHVDFTVEVERSLRVLDGAIAIFDGVAGVEAQSETVWEQADRYGVPRIGFVNKMDREGASYERTAAAMAARLGATPVLCQLPLGEAAEFQGIVDLISMRSYLWKDEEELSFKEVPLTSYSPAIAEKAESQRLAMLEAVADADDTFAEVFLDGKVKESDVIAALRRTTILPGSRIVPLLCGSAYKNKAIQPLLDAVVDFLPSPEERPPLLAHPIKRNAKVERKPSASEPLCALAFKVQKDDSRGPLVFFRVYSGTLRRGMPLLNTTQNTKERPNKLLQVWQHHPAATLTSAEACAVPGCRTRSAPSCRC